MRECGVEIDGRFKLLAITFFIIHYLDGKARKRVGSISSKWRLFTQVDGAAKRAQWHSWILAHL